MIQDTMLPSSALGVAASGSWNPGVKSQPPLVQVGTGVPTHVAPQGTLYVRLDGGPGTTLYICSSGGQASPIATGWTPSSSGAGGVIDGTVNARSAAVAAITVGASDAILRVSGNVNVTASANHSFSLNVDYTDETNAARTLILPMEQLGGTFITGGLITNVTGTGPYESASILIRAKAGTTVTIRPSAGTFTSVTYNAAGIIEQLQ